MRKQIDNTELLKALIVIVVVVIALITFILVSVSKESANINQVMQERIALVEWPEVVPILKNEIYEIKKYGEGSDSIWEISIESDVSYIEYIEYLIDIEASGFKPISEMGSQSPRLFNRNRKIEDGVSNIWYGKSSDYKVNATWKAIAQDEENTELIKSFFKFTLQPVKVNSVNIFDNEINQTNELIESGENLFEFSGDLSFSGETSGESGEVITSGEDI
jgi:hypothetical protein